MNIEDLERLARVRQGVRSQILFRNSLAEEGELEIARQYIPCSLTRTAIPAHSKVIGRYSVLPYYDELVLDLADRECTLINSYDQHRWIADFSWYEDLKDYTPQTWFDYNISECWHPGPFIVKGRTNSRKMEWNQLMFAQTRPAALEIAMKLSRDPLIGPQGIVYRKYVELESCGTMLNGLPITNEHRFFFLGSQLLAHGYYWTEPMERFNMDKYGLDFAQEVAEKASHHTNFFVLDIGRTTSGNWILIEVNDAQMSGVSTINPHELYRNLARVSQ